MALLPYTLVEPLGPIAPLVIDSPHSGSIYPADFVYACPLPLLRQAEDSFVDELVRGGAEAGAVVIAAEFPRSMIDVNRADNDIDPATIEGVWPHPIANDAMTLAGFGLVRRLCRNGISLYRQPLSVGEIQRRLDTYYRPYHGCIAQNITRLMQHFGNCTLLNMHSMPDRTDNGMGRADFILGDRDGSSCDPSLTRQAQRILQDMGYRVTLNSPYKGREIVYRYGLQGMGAQALQIEINRKLYMDESKLEKNDGFSRTQEDLTEFFRLFAKALEVERAEKLAAE